MGHRRFLSSDFKPLTIKFLIVGGGGASYGGAFPGAGAGGVVYNSGYTIKYNKTINVVVGNGGDHTQYWVPGKNSSFNGYIAYGGGGGNYNGASGGGGNYVFPGPGYDSGGTCIVGQGNIGGFGIGIVTPASYNSGGGGGAGSAGGDAVALKSGDGGSGVDYSSIFGTSVGVSGWFAGGGGGGADSSRMHSGGTASSGGGAGGYLSSGIYGTPNTGGGGGGGSNTPANQLGGDGGSGVVIIRYTSPIQRGTGGNTITQISGDWQHVFTSSGTFIPTS